MTLAPTLTPAEVEEIRSLGKHQPVEGGYTISPNAMRSIVKKKLAFWWDDAPRGYVLTDLGKAWLRENPDEGGDDD